MKEKERKQDNKIQFLEDTINNLNKVINEINKRNYNLEKELRKAKDKLQYISRNNYIPIERRYRLRQRYRYRCNYYQNVKRSNQIRKSNNSSNYNSKPNFINDKEEQPIIENLFKNESQSYLKNEEKREPKKKI